MRVEVRLRGALRRFRPEDATGAPHHPFMLNLPAESNIMALTSTLNLPAERVSAAAVNGEAVDADHILQEGDQVLLIPPVAGG